MMKFTEGDLTVLKALFRYDKMLAAQKIKDLSFTAQYELLSTSSQSINTLLLWTRY